MTKCKSKT